MAKKKIPVVLNKGGLLKSVAKRNQALAEAAGPITPKKKKK